MARRATIGFSLAIALLLAGPVSAAPRDTHTGGMGMQAPRGEPHQGPKGYQRVTEPKGWNFRPVTVNKQTYNHNYQAARSYHIGPYHRPAGWTSHHWAYGEILPAAYWTANYILADYWLFGLEVPPVGCEWVRDDDDALLINIATGEIIQVEYGVFG